MTPTFAFHNLYPAGKGPDTVGNKTYPMFETSAQMHLYLSKYISKNDENNNADALTSYLKCDIILNSYALSFGMSFTWYKLVTHWKGFVAT